MMAMQHKDTAMRIKLTSYWVVTAFLLFNVLAGAVAELTQQKGNVEGMIFLGYPLYFMMILGVWKVLGTIALFVPRFPRLKEWAYAGIFGNITRRKRRCRMACLLHRLLGCSNDRFVGASTTKPHPWKHLPG